MSPCSWGIPCVSLIKCELVGMAPPLRLEASLHRVGVRELLPEPHSHPSVGASVKEEAGLNWLEPVTFPSTSYAVGCVLSTSRWSQGVGGGLGRNET